MQWQSKNDVNQMARHFKYSFMYSKYDPKECANCGKLHICTGTVHCPCFNVEVTEEILDYIATHFDECLCNECMEGLKKMTEAELIEL